MRYHCLNCQRAGGPDRFTWLEPLTERQRRAGLDAGATLPDPPLISERQVWCSDCVLARRPYLDVVDEDGRPAASGWAPPVFPMPSVEEQARRIVTRASALPGGRIGHGQSGGLPAGGRQSSPK